MRSPYAMPGAGSAVSGYGSTSAIPRSSSTPPTCCSAASGRGRSTPPPGVFANALLAGSASLVAAILEPSPLRSLLLAYAAFSYLSVVVNLIPFLELDGYWLLTDLLDQPRLRPRSLALLRHDLLDRLRGRRGPFTPAELGLLAFGVAGLVFTVLALVWALLLWLPIATSIGQALWDAGTTGRVTLAAFALLVLGPLGHGLDGVARGLTRWARARTDDLRFRLERGWRVDAARTAAALPLATPLTDAELSDLAGRVVRRRVEGGRVVVRQGTPGDAFYLVGTGRLAVVESDGHGVEQLLRYLGPGEFFGEVALLAHRPPPPSGPRPTACSTRSTPTRSTDCSLDGSRPATSPAPGSRCWRSGRCRSSALFLLRMPRPSPTVGSGRSWHPRPRW